MSDTPTVAPQAASPKHPVEHWAEKRGLLPEWKPQPAAKRRIGERVVDVPQGAVHNRETWKFAAAKHLHGWHIGHELTEAEFDDAVAAACNVRLG